MSILINILEGLGYLLSIISPSVIITKLCSVRNRIYTGYLRKRFKHLGKSIFIYPSYNLIGLNFVNIGNNNIIERDVQLTAWKLESANNPEIIIGNNCLIRRGTNITAVNRIQIGNDLLTGTNVLITDNSHGNTDYQSLNIPTGKRPIISKGETIIGNNVWLGNNVCVMSGVTIGDCAVVGANSIVTHDIPAYSVACGSPAKIIKTLLHD
jgi:acetyltransferase-like isoleucine patch superfamily enzyme